MVNKRGWVRIIEAVIAVLLIAGILLLIVDKGYISKSDESSKIYEIQKSIIRSIQFNESLRQDFLSEDVGTIPDSISQKIQEEKSSFLSCDAKACSLSEECLLDFDSLEDTNVYVYSGVVSSNLQIYSPRQLKLFCWKNE